jgi:hypothetical protein
MKTYTTGTMEQLNTKDRKANLQYLSIYSVISRRTSTQLQVPRGFVFFH